VQLTTTGATSKRGPREAEIADNLTTLEQDDRSKLNMRQPNEVITRLTLNKMRSSPWWITSNLIGFLLIDSKLEHPMRVP